MSIVLSYFCSFKFKTTDWLSVNFIALNQGLYLAEAEFLFPEDEGATKKPELKAKPKTALYLPEFSRNLRWDKATIYSVL